MKSSSLFTYILYALLAVLLLFAGKLVLDKRAEKRLESNSSSEKVATPPPAPPIEKPIIETDEQEENKPIVPKGTASNNKPSTDKPVVGNAKAADGKVKPSTPPAESIKQNKGLTAKGVVQTSPKAKKLNQPGKGRYLVVVGTFSLRENALTEMENMISAGYPNAEVIKYKEDLWRVIALRCKTPEEAAQQEGDLERHGIDAIVVDGYKK